LLLVEVAAMAQALDDADRAVALAVVPCF